MIQKAASPWYYTAGTGGLTDNSSHQLVAGVTGQRQFLSALQYINKSATATELSILDGSTVIWLGYAPASAAKGEEVNFDPPLVSSPGNALNVKCGTTGTNTYVNAQGITDP